MGHYWSSLIQKVNVASEKEPIVLVFVALAGVFIASLLLGLALAFCEILGFWTLPLIFFAAVVGVFLDEIFFSNKK